MHSIVTSDPQKAVWQLSAVWFFCLFRFEMRWLVSGFWLGLYLADQGDRAVVSNMKGQELAEVGTCGEQKDGEDVPGSKSLK